MNIRDWGKTLDSTKIEVGLRELNRDIHCDMGTKIGHWHPYQESRQGVFYRGAHLCSMDRGIVPEFKIWSVKEYLVPVPISEAEKERVSLMYQVVPVNTPGYFDLYEEARQGKHATLDIRADGALVQLTAHEKKKMPHKVVLVGWRHTFERLLKEKIPGVTRESLGVKFGVDMYKYPVGPPEEVVQALVAE